MNGAATSPATDAVFTMCASSCCMRIGTNARTPWMTPHRLTPSTHSHVDSGVSHDSPPPPTPALLHDDVHAAEPVDRGRVGERLHLRGVGHVGDDAVTSAPDAASFATASSSAGASTSPMHDLHALGRERRREPEPDAARAPGDDRNPPVQSCTAEL